MSPEEAVERVLRGEYWRPCPGCGAEGYVAPPDPPGVMLPCGACLGQGYLSDPLDEQAYGIEGAALPPKPLTKMERARTEEAMSSLAQHLSRSLRQPSAARMALPPQMVPNEVLDAYVKLHAELPIAESALKMTAQQRILDKNRERYFKLGPHPPLPEYLIEEALKENE